MARWSAAITGAISIITLAVYFDTIAVPVVAHDNLIGKIIACIQLGVINLGGIAVACGVLHLAATFHPIPKKGKT
jgi:ABC-type uncharacterized transport system permease subunit